MSTRARIPLGLARRLGYDLAGPGKVTARITRRSGSRGWSELYLGPTTLGEKRVLCVLSQDLPGGFANAHTMVMVVVNNLSQEYIIGSSPHFRLPFYVDALNR